MCLSGAMLAYFHPGTSFFLKFPYFESSRCHISVRSSSIFATSSFTVSSRWACKTKALCELWHIGSICLLNPSQNAGYFLKSPLNFFSFNLSSCNPSRLCLPPLLSSVDTVIVACCVLYFLDLCKTIRLPLHCLKPLT